MSKDDSRRILKVMVDTREQNPYTFEGFGVVVERGCLQAGDYSLPGFQDQVAIERKSLDDLVSCLMGSNRERFERELHRGSAMHVFTVICEGSWEDISRGRYRSQMKPQAALQSVIAFMVRYRVPFIMAGSREAAEYITHGILAKYLYEIEQRYRQATKAQRTE